MRFRASMAGPPIPCVGAVASVSGKLHVVVFVACRSGRYAVPSAVADGSRQIAANESS